MITRVQSFINGVEVCMMGSIKWSQRRINNYSWVPPPYPDLFVLAQNKPVNWEVVQNSLLVILTDHVASSLESIRVEFRTDVSVTRSGFVFQLNAVDPNGKLSLRVGKCFNINALRVHYFCSQVKALSVCMKVPSLQYLKNRMSDHHETHTSISLSRALLIHLYHKQIFPKSILMA